MILWRAYLAIFLLSFISPTEAAEKDNTVKIEEQTKPVGWQPTTNPNCRIWNPNPKPKSAATWFGPCIDGTASGAGTLIWRYFEDGVWKEDKFEGSLLEGRFHGRGQYQWADGHQYRGNYRYGLYNGSGLLTLADGTRREGVFEQGQLHGRATYIWPNGTRYVGRFRHGVMDGFGTFQYANGSYFAGFLRDGKAQGLGYYRGIDDQIYIGSWNDGCYTRGKHRASVGVPSEHCGFEGYTDDDVNEFPFSR